MIYKNIKSGAIISIGKDIKLSAEWEPVKKEPKKESKKETKK